MIDIRAFDGGPDELAAFVTPIWVKAYAEEMSVPLWSAEFLEWTLDWNRRDHLVTAWDGRRLIGCLLAKVYAMKYLEQHVMGTQCSFLTVDPDYRRQGIANLMVDQQKKVNEQQNIEFELGYLYTGNNLSMGPKFWKKQQATNRIAATGFWVRNLDHRAVAAWTHNRVDRIGAKSLSLYQRSPHYSPSGAIRGFQVSDLTPCRELVNELSQNSILGIVWDNANLQRQLQYNDIAKTLVWEQEQQVCAFINYCRLDFQANGVIPVGLIDVISIQRLTVSEQVEMLNHTLSEMAKEGIKLAMLLRPGPMNAIPLIRSGFVPRLKDFVLQLQHTSDDINVERTQSLNILWR